jgi:putative restriction endonuclease
LLLLWLFGRFATTGTSVTTYEEAEEPVGNLINEFGPAVATSGGVHRLA